MVVVCFADWKIGGAPSPKKEKKEEEEEENKVFFEFSSDRFALFLFVQGGRSWVAAALGIRTKTKKDTKKYKGDTA